MTRVLINENFNAYADGAVPPGWSAFSFRNSHLMDVQGGALSFRYPGPGATTSPGTQFTWPAKATPDCEYSGRYRMTDGSPDNNRLALVHKCDGLRNSTTGSSGLYFNGWNIRFDGNAELGYVRIHSYQGANGTSGGGVRQAVELRPGIDVLTQWVRYRVQFISDLVRCKLWQDGTAEPADWYEWGDAWLADYMAYSVLGYTTKGNTTADSSDWRLDDFKVENIGKHLRHSGGEVYEPGHFRRHIGGEVYQFERPKVLRPSGLWVPLGAWSNTYETPRVVGGARISNTAGATVNLSVNAATLGALAPGDKLVAATRIYASAEAAIIPPPAVNGVAWTKLGGWPMGGGAWLQLWERVVQPGETGTYQWSTDNLASGHYGDLFAYKGLGAFDGLTFTAESPSNLTTRVLDPTPATTQAEGLVLAVGTLAGNSGNVFNWTGGPYSFHAAPVANTFLWTGQKLTKTAGAHGATMNWTTPRGGSAGVVAAWKAKART